MGSSVPVLQQHIVVAEADYIQSCFRNYFGHRFELCPGNRPRDGRNPDLGLDCRSRRALDLFHVRAHESLLQNRHLVLLHDGLPDLVVLFLELSGLLLTVPQVVNHLLVGRFLRFACRRKI